MGEPLGVSERQCVCVDGSHVMPSSAFQRLMRWWMYNHPSGDGKTGSSVTESTLVFGTHTYIQTLLNDPATIIWLVDIPWPLLTYLLSFGLFPACQHLGVEAETSDFPVSLLFYFNHYFSCCSSVAMCKNVLWGRRGSIFWMIRTFSFFFLF